MTQTVPATAILGPDKTGLTIGLRVLNLDGTTYAAFSTTGVAETSTAGTYRKAGGVVAPLAGGYIVWGEAATDYAEATVDGVQATRDAMKLAPSAGAAAVDSVDEMLTGILAAIGGELVEGAYTRDDVLRIMAAALVGVTGGSGTDTVTFRGLDETTTRITATVSNEGNRTGIVLNAGVEGESV
jgi:hypothetical protein